MWISGITHSGLALKLALIALAAIVAIIIWFAVWMYRDIQREHRAEAAKDVRPALELGRLIVEVVRRTLNLIPVFFETLLCYIFIYFWLAGYRFRSKLARLATAVFLGAGGLAMVEKLLPVLNLPQISSFVSNYKFLAATRDDLRNFFEHPATLAILILVEILLIRRHLREPAHHHHERTTLAVLREALAPLSLLNTRLGQANLQMDDRYQMEQEYWSILSKAMRRLFAERKIDDLDISIMRWNSERECLEIYYASTPPCYDPGFTLGMGEGAGGTAFMQQYSVYIPVIRFRHGVALVRQPDDSIRMRVLLNVYKPCTHPFKTMLAVPIICEGSATVGVVNLSSKRKSAFRGSDFYIAYLTAVILGLMNREPKVYTAVEV